MIGFDLALELTLGAGFAAWPDRDDTRRLAAGLLPSGLVHIPFCAVGLSAWPGWQSMYLVPPAHQPLFAGLSTCALFACFLTGFAGVTWLKGRLPEPGRAQRAVLFALIGLWSVLLPLLFGLLWRRAVQAVSYHDFHTHPPIRSIPWGTPEAALGGPVLYFVAFSGLVVSVSVVVGLRWARVGGARG